MAPKYPPSYAYAHNTNFVEVKVMEVLHLKTNRLILVYFFDMNFYAKAKAIFSLHTYPRPRVNAILGQYSTDLGVIKKRPLALKLAKTIQRIRKKMLVIMRVADIITWLA